MFNLVYDETSQSLGVGIHKKRRYNFEADFLSGAVWHDSTHHHFFLAVEPNYRNLANLKNETSQLRSEFNAARSQTISIGSYSSLDVVHDTVMTLQDWYKKVLKQQGARHHFLVENGNTYQLVEDEQASPLKYGDAIMQARNVQAFNMMYENMPLEYETLVGRIMPVFLQALGLEGYHVSHDLSEEGNGEVRFILEKTAVFSIYKPQHIDGPAYLERYSYLHGDYVRTFAGEATGDIVRAMVFEWLVEAAKEQNTLKVKDPDIYMDQLALDIRKTWISQKSEIKQVIFENDAQNFEKDANTKIVKLGDFRPH